MASPRTSSHPDPGFCKTPFRRDWKGWGRRRTSRPLWRGRAGTAEWPGGGGFDEIHRSADTQEPEEGERLRSPHPQLAILHRYSAWEGITTVPERLPEESCFRPLARPSGQSPRTVRPDEGAGGQPQKTLQHAGDLRFIKPGHSLRELVRWPRAFEPSLDRIVSIKKPQELIHRYFKQIPV